MEFAELDETALAELAAEIAAVLRPGDVVVLAGEVGTGKTTFVRAALHSLGVAERVTSPTYQLARGYEGSGIKANHLDLYRLGGLQERDALELEDYLEPGAVTLIEWAEPALDALEDPTVIQLSHRTPTTRRMSMSGPAAGRLEERKC